MRIYTKYVTRHLPCPCFSRNFVLFPLEKIHDVVVPYKNTTLISRGIILDVLRPISSRYFNVTDIVVNFAAFPVSMTLNVA